MENDLRVRHGVFDLPTPVKPYLRIVLIPLAIAEGVLIAVMCCLLPIWHLIKDGRKPFGEDL